MAECEAARLAEEARREAEMERAELLARREWERQPARQAADAASITKPRWDMPEARLEARGKCSAGSRKRGNRAERKKSDCLVDREGREAHAVGWIRRTKLPACSGSGSCTEQ
jgi:hypothetical protein